MAAGVSRAAQSAANMGKSMIDAAMNALGIKSPSREFAKVGYEIIEA
mgnify:CR=1 FL=1